MFWDFSIVPLAAITVLIVLGLLVVLYYAFVSRTKSAEEAKLVPPAPTIASTTWRAKFKAQERDPFQIKLSGDHKTVHVNGQAAVFHAEGQVDSPVVAKHKDKYILTYTVGGRALYCSIRDPASLKWSPPTCVTVAPQIQTASAYPLIYKTGLGKLFSTYSPEPIASFEPSPFDSSEPTTLVLSRSEGIVLMVYASKDRGLYRIRSIDAGKSWSAVHLIVADASACRPKLFETKQGIQLVYLSLLSDDKAKAELYLTNSIDNGLTFSPIAQKIGPESIELATKKDPYLPNIYLTAEASELTVLNHRISI